MRNHKDLEREVALVMECLDMLVDEFKILKLNSPQQMNNLTYNGWGSGDKVRTLSFKFSTTEPKRDEIESKVRSFVMRGKLD